MENNISNQISLNFPFISLKENDQSKIAIEKQIDTIFEEIKNILYKLIREGIYEFDKKDIKIFKQEKFPGSNPVSLTNRDIRDKSSLDYLASKKKDFLFCLKSDGTRYLWVILENGEQYYISRKMDIFKANVKLNPFFFRDKSPELLFLKSKIDFRKFAETKNIYKTNLQGEAEIHSKEFGTFKNLSNNNNQHFQTCINSSQWKLKQFMKQENEKQKTFLSPNQLFELKLEDINKTLESTQFIFKDINTEKNMFEEWVLQSNNNTQNLEQSPIEYIFDGELIEKENKDWEFLLFDTLMYNKKLKIAHNYHERLQLCQIFQKKNKFFDSFFNSAQHKTTSQVSSLLTKNYSPSTQQPILAKRDNPFEQNQQENPNNSQIFWNNLLQTPKKLKEVILKTKDYYKPESVKFLLEEVDNVFPFKGKTDGIIITRNNYPYVPGRSVGILKWKPDQLNSIDFLVSLSSLNFNMENNGKLYELYVVSGENFLLFDYMLVHNQKDINHISQVERNYTIGNINLKGSILELSYDKQFTHPHLSNTIITQPPFIKNFSDLVKIPSKILS